MMYPISYHVYSINYFAWLLFNNKSGECINHSRQGFMIHKQLSPRNQLVYGSYIPSTVVLLCMQIYYFLQVSGVRAATNKFASTHSCWKRGCSECLVPRRAWVGLFWPHACDLCTQVVYKLLNWHDTVWWCDGRHSYDNASFDSFHIHFCTNS